MGYLRFWRRKRILPGVTLNVSKRGVSTSFGARGAHVTIGRRGVRKTVGIPGTGLYYTAQSGRRPHGGGAARRASPLVWLVIAGGAIALVVALVAASTHRSTGTQALTAVGSASPPASAPASTAATAAPVVATAVPTSAAAPQPTAVPTQAPATAPPPPLSVATVVPTIVPTPTPPVDTCGAPSNPWGYNLCQGKLVYTPPASFCDVFNCIGSFWDHRNGYVDECADGTYSHSGGVRGACSYHGGEKQPLFGP